jgi:hypothetical protein
MRTTFVKILSVLLGFVLSAVAVGAAPARPKVGLVLGGGGALGFSHVGVLRALEEQRITIDSFAGTAWVRSSRGSRRAACLLTKCRRFWKGSRERGG